MNGESPSATNQSAAFSARTTGATGRKSSRSLISLRRACISASMGEARIDRAPSALGPNSMRPWNQPRIRPAASSVAASSRDVVQAAKGQLRPGQKRLDLGIRVAGTEVGVVHLVPPLGGAALPGIDPQRGAERRPGVAGGRLDPDALERPLVAERAFITQFSATPPARQRSRSPVVSCSQ